MEKVKRLRELSLELINSFNVDPSRKLEPRDVPLNMTHYLGLDEDYAVLNSIIFSTASKAELIAASDALSIEVGRDFWTVFPNLVFALCNNPDTWDTTLIETCANPFNQIEYWPNIIKLLSDHQKTLILNIFALLENVDETDTSLLFDALEYRLKNNA